MFGCATSGGAGRTGVTNAQWAWYFAPSAIHRVSVSFWSLVSTRFDFGGGIRSEASWLMIRSTTALASTSPGTIASDSIADSRKSSRRSALRWLASRPWQGKQFSARMGRTSRLKSTSGGDAAGTSRDASPKRAKAIAKIIATNLPGREGEERREFRAGSLAGTGRLHY